MICQKPSLTFKHKLQSEFRFWTTFLLVIALFCQVLFPKALMAASLEGQGFELCNSEHPTQDLGLIQAVKSEKQRQNTPKCEHCLALSPISLLSPVVVSIPIIYEAEAAGLGHETRSPLPKARAPPRPHSCGPPLSI
jgi:hypothetical protein